MAVVVAHFPQYPPLLEDAVYDLYSPICVCLTVWLVYAFCVPECGKSSFHNLVPSDSVLCLAKGNDIWVNGYDCGFRAVQKVFDSVQEQKTYWFGRAELQQSFFKGLYELVTPRDPRGGITAPEVFDVFIGFLAGWTSWGVFRVVYVDSPSDRQKVMDVFDKRKPVCVVSLECLGMRIPIYRTEVRWFPPSFAAHLLLEGANIVCIANLLSIIPCDGALG